MNTEDLKQKILELFSENMEPEKRILLIKLYDACVSNKINQKELHCNLFQIENAFDTIEANLERYLNKDISNVVYVDADNVKLNKKRYFKIGMELLKKIRKNNIKKNLIDKANNNFIEGKSKIFTKTLENYLMLEDCIRNYDEENIQLKKQTIDLITETEILLKLPVTFPSRIPNCVDNLIDGIEEQKGGEYSGRTNK